MTYLVKTGEFSGPLDKLLELIEARELDVTRVSLADVTDDFLIYLKDQGSSIDSGILADFLVVAAKLVLLKSKTLLPELPLTDEEEADIDDLEARLIIYRDFAARNLSGRAGTASAHLLGLWERRAIAYPRPFLMALSETTFFYPSPNLTSENLALSAEHVMAELGAFLPEPSKIKAVIVSLEEKIRELLLRCREAANQSFRKLTGNRSRPEVVALFLAMLHLLKRREIRVEQEHHFGDIIVTNNDKPAHEQ